MTAFILGVIFGGAGVAAFFVWLNSEKPDALDAAEEVLRKRGEKP